MLRVAKAPPFCEVEYFPPSPGSPNHNHIRGARLGLSLNALLGVALLDLQFPMQGRTNSGWVRGTYFQVP